MSRRFVNTVTSALMLIGLGLVIAISARSMPGDDQQDTLGDIHLEIPDWVGTVFVWVVLAIAGMVALYLFLAMRRGGSWADLKRVLSRLLTVIVWAGGFYLIYAIARPPAEEAATGSLPQLEPDAVVDMVDVEPSVTAGWVAGVLSVVIIAAALVRLSMSMRTGRTIETTQTESIAEPMVVEQIAEPLTMIPSTDPRSRVINAYAEFELRSKEEGLGRLVSETARHHAGRAGPDLGVEPADLRALGDQYERARFAESHIEEGNAEVAESAWQRIKDRISR